MADGLTTQTTVATIPDATKIATDDAGAAGHVQMVKLAIATDGSATALTADNTDGLLVNLGANNDVTVAGVATAANQATGNTSLATIAGAVSGTEMQVDVLSMPSTTVTATNLDIRDLTSVSDSVAVLQATASNLNATVVGTGTFAVQAAIDELPAAAALSDNFANPTTTSIGAMGMIWDGVTWDRAAGNSTDGLLVNLGTNNDVTVTNPTAANLKAEVIGTGTFAVQAAIDELPAAAAASDNFANPTTTNLMAMGMVWDGATWDRAAGNSADGALVNLGANNDVTVTSGTITTVTTVTTLTTATTLTGSSIAHDSPDSTTNPHKIGAKAVASTEAVTLVAANDRTDLYADVDGVLVVKPSCTNDDVVSERVSNTDGASTAFTNFAAVASTHNCVSAISIFNSSASAVFIDFRDGTAGSVLFTMGAPAGGGSVISCGNQPYLFRTSQNTALAFDGSAAASTVYISVSGYQSKA